MKVPLGMTVSTTVAVIVLINLHVTNKPDTVIADVIRDILLKTVTMVTLQSNAHAICEIYKFTSY